MCGNLQCGTTLALPKLGYFEPVRVCNICENGVIRLSRQNIGKAGRNFSTMNVAGKPRSSTPDCLTADYYTKNTRSHIESRTTRFESSDTLQAVKRDINFE